MAHFGGAAADPLDVARQVLYGIRNNNAYIFTHPESKDEVRELFEEILAAFPDEATVSSARIQFESQMRSMRAAERAAARAGST
jgi:hypothetical protein